MELKGKDFKEKVLDSNKPVLVDFWGSWCIPCKQMEPIVMKLKEEFQDLRVFQVNVNRNPVVADQHHIMGVPTFILFKDGKEKDRAVGAQTADQLKKFLQDNLT